MFSTGSAYYQQTPLYMKRFLKKKWAIGLVLLVAAVGGYVAYGQSEAPAETRYVLTEATKGTLVVSISGSGNVSAENQLDVMAGVSGAVTQVLVKTGETVTEGTPLIEVDRRDAVKTVRTAEQNVRDAQISLESAQISYEKLFSPESDSNVLQAQNALNQAERNLAELLEGPDELEKFTAEERVRVAENNAKLADDGVTPKTVRDTYDKTVNTLQTILNSTQNALDDSNDILAVEGNSANTNLTQLFSVLDQSKKINAVNSYANAKSKIEEARDAIDPLEIRNEDMEEISDAIPLLREAIDATADLLKHVKSGLESTLTSASFSQSSLDSYKSTIQSDLTAMTSANSTLTAQEDSIDDAYDAYTTAQADLKKAKAELAELLAGADANDIANARETLEERKRALADAQDGADPDDIDIKVAKNTIAQRQSSLTNARDTLAEAIEELNDYTVKAPFDGVIAELTVNKADQVSQNTAIVTLLTEAKIAEIALNEVDVAKVEVGQKATMTFDAVADLTIAGTVSEVDMIGTATQGVVTYNVKIAFLTEDERIKAGMSASASIATDVKTDVVLVPNGAVKSGQNGGSSVQMISGITAQAAANPLGVTSPTPPESRAITTGLSNDSMTEVTEGLSAGEFVITRTIDASAQTATPAASTGSTTRAPQSGAGMTGAMMRF